MNLAFIVGSLLGATVLILLILDRIRVEHRLREIEEQTGNVVPYWQAIQAKLIVDLTHPHPAASRVDELLQLLKENPTLEMTEDDREELLEGLKRRAAGDDPHITSDERRKAAIFPLVMEEVQSEAANPNPIGAVQLIGIKEPTKDDE